MKPDLQSFHRYAEYLEAVDTWERKTTEGAAERAARRAAEEAKEARYQHRLRQQKADRIEIPPKDFEIIERGGVAETAATKALGGTELVVCLSGNPGCGKTTGAAAMLYAGGAGLFVKAARLSRWERYNDDEMNRLLKTPVLVIDDLGVEYQDAKGNFLAILDEVIDYRYDHRLRTVLTTNLDAEQFKERYGERIADRIRESGKFVSLATDSMRRRPQS